MTKRVNIFGYMRFSYLGQSDARLSRLVSGQEQFDLVFHPDRMAQRFYVFEHITLPSLKAQRFEDWKIYILTSEDMPAHYKDKLRELTADVPQIDIIERRDIGATQAFGELVQHHVSEATERTIHFRTDDDDALANNVMEVFEAQRERAPSRALINMPKGLFIHSDGENVSLLRKFEHNIAIAWALVNDPGNARNPYHFRHRQYWERVNSVILAEFPAYIHCAYESCDTEPAQQKQLRKAIAAYPDFGTKEGRNDISRALRRHFGWTTYDDLISIFRNIPQGHKTAVWKQG